LTTSGGNITETTLNDDNGVLFENVGPLSASETYTICETGIPAGWTSIWMVDAASDPNGIDGIPETVIIPYNPNAFDDPPADLGTRCFDFGANTPYPLPVGATGITCVLVFQVNNTFPGGDPRTPGYWKNWNTCSGGNQQHAATKNANDVNGDGQITGIDRVNSGWALLDDILNDPGISWCDFTIETCEDGISILDQRDLNTGRKKSSDAAYTLAMHLLAAQLNQAAGAETCEEVEQAIVDAVALLCGLNNGAGFDGTGDYLKGKGKNGKNGQYQTALDLAYILDKYNNGCLCGEDNDPSCASEFPLSAPESSSNLANEVKTVDILDRNRTKVTVYPNPASNQFNLVFTGWHEEEVIIQVYDALGRQIKEDKTFVLEGEPVRIRLDNRDHDGMYFINIRGKDKFKVLPIMITRPDNIGQK
jgi:hypothetical protein